MHYSRTSRAYNVLIRHVHHACVGDMARPGLRLTQHTHASNNSQYSLNLKHIKRGAERARSCAPAGRSRSRRRLAMVRQQAGDGTIGSRLWRLRVQDTSAMTSLASPAEAKAQQSKAQFTGTPAAPLNRAARDRGDRPTLELELR
jgi:hypothetical protein